MEKNFKYSSYFNFSGIKKSKPILGNSESPGCELNFLKVALGRGVELGKVKKKNYHLTFCWFIYFFQGV